MAVAEQSISLKTRRKTEVRIILGWHTCRNKKIATIEKINRRETKIRFKYIGLFISGYSLLRR